MTMRAAAGRRLSVLHVSGDFPDPIEPCKTPVIRRLIDLTAGAFDHRVISLNRRTPSLSSVISGVLKPALPTSRMPFDHGEAIVYEAPPKGIFHRTGLGKVGDFLVREICGSPHRPDLLAAHKLTIEGIAVARAARALGIPYCLTIQGNTDRKILRARPDLRPQFRSIYRNAETVFAFTPNARAAIEKFLGKRPDGIRLMPCPMEMDAMLPPKEGGGGLISVFHLRNHRVKNLDGLAAASSLLDEQGHRHSIRLIGGGEDDDLAACRRAAASTQSIEFSGPLEPRELRRHMNEAVALVMPSRTESFGLVFIEALFSGLPIIYPAGTAIDGYFDGCPFALRVDPKSPQAIAEAMQRAIEEEASMKAALADWQTSPASLQFTRPAIAQIFEQGLAQSSP